MNFADSIKTVWRKYWIAAGRAGRAEFGYWSALVIVLQALLQLGENDSYSIMALSLLFASIVAFPTMNVSIRRLHDAGMSGGWLIMAGMVSFLFEGVVSNIVYTAILWVMPPTVGKNRYDTQEPKRSYGLAFFMLLVLLILFVTITWFVKDSHILDEGQQAQVQQLQQLLQQIQQLQQPQ